MPLDTIVLINHNTTAYVLGRRGNQVVVRIALTGAVRAFLPRCVFPCPNMDSLPSLDNLDNL